MPRHPAGFSLAFSFRRTPWAIVRALCSEALKRRHAQTGQTALVYFVSDLDPSGLDLQRAWEKTIEDFGVWHCLFERIGLTHDQVRSHVDARGRPLDGLGIEVKPSDSRAESYIEQYGRRCWEADILPASVIEQAISDDIRSWFNAKLWKRRDTEIERARALL